ncbi:MAG: hypothetical protein ABL984_15435 [Pyrinomonadaceae bacterium]
MVSRKRFLLSKRPASLRQLDGVDVVEGYIARGDVSHLVRREGTTYFLVENEVGESGLVDERRLEISQSIFGMLWRATKGQRSSFRAFEYTESSGLTWTIEEYHGREERILAFPRSTARAFRINLSELKELVIREE